MVHTHARTSIPYLPVATRTRMVAGCNFVIAITKKIVALISAAVRSTHTTLRVTVRATRYTRHDGESGTCMRATCTCTLRAARTSLGDSFFTTLGAPYLVAITGNTAADRVR